MISKQIDAKYALLPTDGGESMSCISSGLGYVLGNSGNEANSGKSRYIFGIL